MRVLIFTILIMIAVNFTANAGEQGNPENLPTEFAGYMVYEGINNEGDKVYVRKPVRYKLYNGNNIPDDNDAEYEYRNYRKEHGREIEEHQSAEERNNINSAANYPIYFNE